LLCSSTGSAQVEPPRQHRRTQRVLMWAVQELARTEGLAVHCDNRRAILRHLRRVRAKLNGLMNRAAPPPPGPEVSSTPATPVLRPMSPRAFARLLDSVKAQVMTRGKRAVIAGAADHNHFTSRQVFTLLGTLPFSRDKLKTLKRLARRITDRESSFTIIDAFAFQRDKAKARKILQRAR